MGVMDSIDEVSKASTTSTKTERPKANMWANIGYTASNGEFVGLPYGIPLDTQNEVEVRGGDQQYVNLMAAKNALLKALIEETAKLEPGESKEVNLVVQISRVKTKLTADEDSPYTKDLANLFG